MTVHVSGNLRVLFERHELEVEGDPPITVPAFRCRWCGFTVVCDARDPLPDHACTGPERSGAFRGIPEPPSSHVPP